jgi:hypothetical protein
MKQMTDAQLLGKSSGTARACSREQLAQAPVNFIFCKLFQTRTLWTSCEALRVLVQLSGLRLAEFWVHRAPDEEESIQDLDRLSVPVALTGSGV